MSDPKVLYVLAFPKVRRCGDLAGIMPPVIEWKADVRWGSFHTNLAAKRAWVERMHFQGLPAPPDAHVKAQFRADSVNLGLVKVMKVKMS